MVELYGMIELPGVSVPALLSSNALLHNAWVFEATHSHPSAHLPSKSTKPAAHPPAVMLHTPLAHWVPFALTLPAAPPQVTLQLLPHVPQLFGSVAVFTSQPLLGSPSQSA